MILFWVIVVSPVYTFLNPLQNDISSREITSCSYRTNLKGREIMLEKQNARLLYLKRLQIVYFVSETNYITCLRVLHF